MHIHTWCARDDVEFLIFIVEASLCINFLLKIIYIIYKLIYFLYLVTFGLNIYI
jgi:hypothetical protein